MPEMITAPEIQQQPQYLNLAHQFLDTNFIESTKHNKFNVLPIISTNPIRESFIRSDPPIAVDYFSYKLTSKQYHSCWKNISNNQFMKPYELSNVDNVTRLRTVQHTDDLMMFLPTTSQARLENACWRAWYKNLKGLQELDPTEINWFKENDITVLYGPLIEEKEDGEDRENNSKEHIHGKTDNALLSPSGCGFAHGLDQNDQSDQSEYWKSDCSTCSSESESDSDSLLFQRRYSMESARTSISSDSNLNLANDSKELKGILKKRRNIYSSGCKSQKKRISFCHELINIRIIA